MNNNTPAPDFIDIIDRLTDLQHTCAFMIEAALFAGKGDEEGLTDRANAGGFILSYKITDEFQSIMDALYAYKSKLEI